MGCHLLVSRGTIETITPAYIDKLRRSETVSSCNVIVGYRSQLSQYADKADCIVREDCILGNYQNYQKELGIVLQPVDKKLIDEIKPVFFDVMMMQRRFEDRAFLRISKRLEDHYQLALRQLLFWNSFLDQRKIDLVILSDVPHEAYDNMIYGLCRVKGIQVILYRYFFKTNRYFIMNEYEKIGNMVKASLDQCRKTYANVAEKEIPLSKSVEAFYLALQPCQKNEKLFYAETLRANEFAYRFGEYRLRHYIKDTLRRRKEAASGDGKQKKPWIVEAGKYVENYLLIQKKRISTKRLAQSYARLAEQPIRGEKYIYYALHLLPECSVSPMGGSYSDQFFPIHLISACLPNDWKLYVKIHPAQVDMMISIEDIKKYKKLKNVRIISENTNQKELIKNAVAVATLTGEIAVEALFYDVPSLIFGYIYYGEAPLSFQIETKAQLQETIEHIRKKEVKCNSKDKKIYFKALENMSYEGVENVMAEIVRRIEEE